MKSVGKILSACALILMVVGCRAAEKEQKFYITNATGKPIYGNIYKTSLSGVVEQPGLQSYYTIAKKGHCIDIPITRSSKLLKGTSKSLEYNTIIFSTDKQDLKARVMRNTKKPSTVGSTLIPQHVFTEAKDLECFWVEGSNKIKITRKKSCTEGSCKASLNTSLATEAISGISDTAPRETTATTPSNSKKKTGKTSQLEGEAEGFAANAARLRAEAERKAKRSTLQALKEDVLGMSPASN
ncbi:MAG: hypothetical protein IT346_02090 [Epsilonproteobacteria bacterium]|nr:hypothetical protein [Campylobacterota bacterium]